MKSDNNTYPLVSVIIPSYNSAQYLEETILSVINQTYPNIEIIIIDDGSTDATKQVVNRYLNKIQYHYQNNAGVSASRNYGAKISKGTLLCFLDADDWFFPANIEQKVKTLANSNANVALAHSIVDVTDEKLENSLSILKGKSGNVLNDLLNLFPPAIPCPSNALIKKEVLEEVGYFDIDLSTAADYDLWLRIASKFEVLRIDEVLIKYRQHSTNMFSNLELQVNDLKKIFAKYPLLFNAKKGILTKKKFYYSIAASHLKKGNFVKFLLYTSLYFQNVVKFIFSSNSLKS